MTKSFSKAYTKAAQSDKITMIAVASENDANSALFKQLYQIMLGSLVSLFAYSIT
jgi:hypothetical protein